MGDALVGALLGVGGGDGIDAGAEAGGGEFARARAFFQVGETGLRGAELVGGLLLGGELVGAFKGEERGGGGDARALGDGEGLESAGERRGDVDEFAFEVALPAGGCRARARGGEESDERGGEGGEKRAAHGVTTGSAGGNLQGRKRRILFRRRLKPRLRCACLRARPAEANGKTDLAVLIARQDLAALKKYVEPWLPADLAPLVAELSVEELAALFRLGSRELAVATFTYVPIDGQKKLLKMLTPEQAAALLNALPPDDRTALLNELPLDVAMQMLAMLTPDERQVAQALLAYPEHGARPDLGRHRILADRGLVDVFHGLRPALAARGLDGRPGTRRHRAVGLADGFDAAARAQTPGFRPGDVERPVRGDARGCDRVDHLFQRSIFHHARDAVVGKIPVT